MIRRIAIGVFIGGAVAAFAADEPLPKAETILDRHVEVTGGKAAYQKRKSEVTTGTLEFAAQGLKGTLTRYAADPDKTYSEMEIDGIGKVETGVADGMAWEKSALLGPRVKTGEERTQSLREATFNAPLQWRKMYPKVETAGIETIGGESCYKLVLTPPAGNAETMYFQKKSGLLVKTAMIAVNQMGEIPVESSVSDYKNFDGLLVPTKVTQKAGGQEFTITIQSVKTNVELPADRFEPPAEIKSLLNKAGAAKQ
jgi:hypothetical protein